MRLPLTTDDVKIVQGQSGRGLQAMCVCGCVNWNHLEIQEPTWRCRNCRCVLTHDFTSLAESVLASEIEQSKGEQLV